MKLFKTLYISLSLVIILSCNGNIYNPETKNTEQDSMKLIKFNMVMTDILPNIWSSIRIFEISQTNSPYDKESLEIKTCISKLSSHNIRNIRDNELGKIKKEFNISYSSINPALENTIYNYIDNLSIFLDFTIDKMNDSIYTTATPVATWEKDIRLIDINSKLAPNKNLYVAIRDYKLERNNTMGPVSQVLDKYESEIFESSVLFYMRDFVSQIIDGSDIDDNQNVDYYFWQGNKQKFINSSICSK